jgi:hypothetical protein
MLIFFCIIIFIGAIGKYQDDKVKEELTKEWLKKHK